jgi:ubiquinone/menaquinone biosynthesis C-methylase UbiE
MSNPVRYQRIAPFYDLLDLPFEYSRYRTLRRGIFHDLRGGLVDAGAGTGRNFAWYPSGADVVAIDISAAMLARAQPRRLSSPAASITLCLADVTRLPLPDARFDAAIATFLFCVLPDDQQLAALRELARVVRPGGRIRLLDYVRPPGRARRLITRLWEPWVTWAYGASFDRLTEAHVAATGLVVANRRMLADGLIRRLDLVGSVKPPAANPLPLPGPSR